MKKILIPILFFVCLMALQSCYYDKAEQVYPIKSNTCDTSAMTYTTHVQPIIQNYCYSCHAGAASAGAGIVLDSYLSLKAFVPSGSLVNRLVTTDPSILMPKGGPKLSDCDISKIKAWINAGAPN